MMLLQGEFSATAEFCPSLALLTVGEPLLVKCPWDWDLVNTQPPGKDPHHLLGCVRGKLLLTPTEHLPAAFRSPAASAQPRPFSAAASGFLLHFSPKPSTHWDLPLLLPPLGP